MVQRKREADAPLYDFAVSDYVLSDEWSSLEGLQRAIKQGFGFDFYFGDVAPALTTTKSRLICDYYVIRDYDVSLDQLCENGETQFEWMSKDELFSRLKAEEFVKCPINLIEYLFAL